jgi:hypothetical protein
MDGTTEGVARQCGRSASRRKPTGGSYREAPPGVPSGRANERAASAQRPRPAPTAAAGSLARVVLQSARFPGVGALDPMRAPYACLSMGIAGISYGQELKGRCAKKPL